jgi:hypothetical protein
MPAGKAVSGRTGQHNTQSVVVHGLLKFINRSLAMPITIHSHSDIVHQLVSVDNSGKLIDISDMVVGRRSSADKLAIILNGGPKASHKTELCRDGHEWRFVAKIHECQLCNKIEATIPDIIVSRVPLQA